MGQIKDAESVVTQTFKTEGHDIVLLGEAICAGLGGSEIAMQAAGELRGPAPRIDLVHERKLQTLLIECAEAGILAGAHDISDGGLVTTLAECCTPEVGATIEMGDVGGATATSLFGEAPSRVVVSVSPDHRADLNKRARSAGVQCATLGRTTSAGLQVTAAGVPEIEVTFEQIHAARESCLEPIVGA